MEPRLFLPVFMGGAFYRKIFFDKSCQNAGVVLYRKT